MLFGGDIYFDWILFIAKQCWVVSLPLLYNHLVTPPLNEHVGFHFVSLHIFPCTNLNPPQTLVEVWNLLLCVQMPQGTSWFPLFAPWKDFLLEPSISQLQCGFLSLLRPARSHFLWHSENLLGPFAVWKSLLTWLQIFAILGLLPYLGRREISSSSFLKMDGKYLTSCVTEKKFIPHLHLINFDWV